MKLKLPLYLLCEDPTNDNGDTFIYHTASRSLIRVVHVNEITYAEAQNIKAAKSAYLDYAYTNTVGNTQNIIFVAEHINGADQASVLAQCAHWYACYLGWEKDCDDLVEIL